MKWTPGGESGDIEDRRDEGGGGGGGFQIGGLHIGIGGAIVLAILSFVFKTNLFSLLGGGTGGIPARRSASPIRPAMPRKSRWCNMCLSFWMTRRTPGRRFCRNKPTPIIGMPSWCFSATHAIRLRRSRIRHRTLLLP